jgi:hypothetical protein
MQSDIEQIKNNLVKRIQNTDFLSDKLNEKLILKINKILEIEGEEEKIKYFEKVVMFLDSFDELKDNAVITYQNKIQEEIRKETDELIK